jgi:hypothetical protein
MLANTNFTFNLFYKRNKHSIFNVIKEKRDSPSFVLFFGADDWTPFAEAKKSKGDMPVPAPKKGFMKKAAAALLFANPIDFIRASKFFFHKRLQKRKVRSRCK